MCSTDLEIFSSVPLFFAIMFSQMPILATTTYLASHSTMPSVRIADLLGCPDRRSIGQSNEVARLVLRNPKLFRELMACLWHENPVVRMRAADAVEKVSEKRPEVLQRYKTQLLGLLAETEQIELAGTSRK